MGVYISSKQRKTEHKAAKTEHPEHTEQNKKLITRLLSST